ncbi:hypothetical protein, partial [Klebsiella variicola]|uniref:hypothetical protein n=1 Tax=Klebsiella variicola TaxID=244366 RepID=UPI00066763CB
ISFFYSSARALFLFISAQREAGKIKTRYEAAALCAIATREKERSARRLRFPGGVKKMNLKLSWWYLLLAFLWRTDGATP